MAQMTVQIQCKQDDGNWRGEVMRVNAFSAFLAAKAKALITGKTYRLVDSEGQIIEVVSHKELPKRL
jgi:hypothetical protein